MSRARHQRLLVTGQLEATSPLHVGGLDARAETDLPLARDGRGRLYVPGTALAGPIRAWIADRIGDDHARDLFGFQDGEDGSASCVFIEDALVGDNDVEVWDGVGIDREHGVAAESIKFDREILRRGSRLSFEMAIEICRPEECAETRAIVHHLLTALEQGAIRFGAASTRGMGGLRARELVVRDEDWSSKEGVLAVLRGKAPSRRVADLDASAVRLTPETTLHVAIRWRPQGPVMVKAGQDGIAVDALPFVSAVGGEHVALTIPGSAIKGALRSHGERIVRTLLEPDDPTPWAGLAARKRHQAQLQVRLVTDLFGTDKKTAPARSSDASDAPPPDPAPGPRPGRGALAVDTCYEVEGSWMRRNAWAAIAASRSQDTVAPGQKSSLYGAIAFAKRELDAGKPPAPYFQQAHHVAVDRWTGGAAEHLLFSALDPFETQWDDLRLRLDFTRLAPDTRDVAVALLLLVLRDLQDGRITIGFGANRGYGTMEIEEIRFTTVGDAFHWIHEKSIAEALVGAQHLEAAWNIWLDDAGRAA